MNRSQFEQLLRHSIRHIIRPDDLSPTRKILQIDIELQHDLDNLLLDDSTFSISFPDGRGIDNHEIPDIPVGQELSLEIEIPSAPGLYVFAEIRDWVSRAVKGPTPPPIDQVYLIDLQCFADDDRTESVRCSIDRFHSVNKILDMVQNYKGVEGWLIVNKSSLLISQDIPQEVIEAVAQGKIRNPSALQAFLKREDHQEQRLAIVRGALIRFLEREPSEQRLAFLLGRIETIATSCASSFDLYLDKFSYDQLRHEVQTETIELFALLNKALIELRSQVVVMGTFAIALSQFTPSAWFQNGIILLAIFIGTFLYNLILKGQAEAIKDIGARTKKIEQELKSRQEVLFNRDFAKDFEDLTARVKQQNNRLLCFQWGLWITFAVACGLFTVISSQQPRL